MKGINTSIFDFPTLRDPSRDYVCVDKTAQLFEIMRPTADCIYYLPRRFDKSLMISTLKALFEGGRELFTGLAYSSKASEALSKAKVLGLRLAVAAGLAALALTGSAETEEQRREWQGLLKQIPSTADGTSQPCYFWAPDAAKSRPVPLIVGLHTWSGDYRQLGHYMTVLAAARKRGWAFVGPNFRGPNSTPAACGGDLAVQDIVDAVDYAKRTVKIDSSRVYIIGGSGGGHMTLLMLGRHPEIFAAGSAFCPITDLARWHADSLEKHPGRVKRYAKMMEGACGGSPSEKTEEYRHRSPLTHLGKARAARVPTYIATGIHDGWKGSVPVGHAFRAFNALAEERDRVGEAEIAAVERDQRIPDSLFGEKVSDPFYSEKMKIHFRRTSGSVRLTIFEGGHGGNFAAGFDFLSRQKKGAPADWTLPEQGVGKEEKLAH